RWGQPLGRHGMRQELRPALAVPCQGEDQGRRCRHIDPDRAPHRDAAGNASPTPYWASSTRRIDASSASENHAQVSVEPSSSSRSSPPVIRIVYTTPRKWRSPPPANGEPRYTWEKTPA